MPERFVFRQVYAGDLNVFLDDGEIRAKNHVAPQLCHQTSYQDIVDRRGGDEFEMPYAAVVNDYVPFYFCPLTSFTYAIHCGKVPLRSPQGEVLGNADDAERIFFVCRVSGFRDCGLETCFSDFPLNSQAPKPTIEEDLHNLESHIHWDVFDEAPWSARIPEVGYDGVCKFFVNKATPPSRQLRRQKRMAEFLVRDAVPLTHVVCVVAKSENVRDNLQMVMDASRWSIPVLAKPGCYF